MKLNRDTLRKLILNELKNIKEQQVIRVKSQGRIPQEDLDKMDKYFKEYFEPHMLYLNDEWVHQFDDWRQHNSYMTQREKAVERCIRGTGDNVLCNYVIGSSESDGYIDPSTGKNNVWRWEKTKEEKKLINQLTETVLRKLLSNKQ